MTQAEIQGVGVLQWPTLLWYPLAWTLKQR